MGYGSAADEEHILTYAASQEPQSSSSAPSNHQQNQQSNSKPMAVSSSDSQQDRQDQQMNQYQTPLKSTNSQPGQTGDQSDASAYNYPDMLTSQPSAVYERVHSYALRTWNECRPWSEFYSTALISLPSFHSLSDRISTNIHVYKPNYQVILAFWLGIFFIFSIPSFLVALVSFLLLDRMASKQAAKNNGQLPHKQMILIGFLALIIIWITGIAQHVITSLAFSFLTISCHTALHEPVMIETEIANV